MTRPDNPNYPDPAPWNLDRSTMSKSRRRRAKDRRRKARRALEIAQERAELLAQEDAQ